MPITFEFKDEKLQVGIIQLAVATDKSWPEILRPQCRLICIDLVKYTQPFGMDEGARAKGQKAVISDVEKVYASPAQIYQRIKSVGKEQVAKYFWKKYKQNNLSAALNAVHAIGSLNAQRATIGQFDKNIYVTRRNNRGRIYGKEISQIVLNFKKVDTLIKQKIAKVGFAKGGWAECARQLGGTRGIPGWVSRQKSPGQVIDRSYNPINPSITMINEINYTTSVLSESNQKAVVRDALAKIAVRVDNALEYNAKKHLE